MKRLLLLAFLALLVAAAPASAYEYEPMTYNGFIDGSDAVGVSSPSFEGLGKLAFDQATQTLYATSSEDQGRVYKFDANTRESQPFAELAPSSVFVQRGGAGFAVDNSGTSTQGLIFDFPEFGPINVNRPGGGLKTDVYFEPRGTICGAAFGPDGHLWISSLGGGFREYLPDGATTGKVIVPDPGPQENRPEACDFAIDSHYNFYAPESTNGGFITSYVKKYNSNGVFQYRIGNGLSRSVAVDLKDDSVYVYDRTGVEKYSPTGSLLDEFGEPEPSGAPCPTSIEQAGECYNGVYGSGGIAVNESTGEVYVADHGYPERIDIFAPSGPPTIAADVTTETPVPTPTTAVLRGTLNPDGAPTISCKFEWGGEGGFEYEVPCVEGGAFSGSGDQHVSDEITGLTLGSTYQARLVVENANGHVSYGLDRFFTAQGKPILRKAFVNGLNTDSARLNAEIDSDRGTTTYHFEYGTDTSYGTTFPAEDAVITPGGMQTVGQLVQGLHPGTEYHYRVVASNLAGVSTSADHVFRTFAQVSGEDECGNVLSRQQTGAALLPDCRSYELASARDSGGYDVESDLVPGQQPFDGPTADGRLLYGVHDGGIPNSGNPTNHGLDPYLATRSESGWTTKYVGIPANGTPSITPFASNVVASDEDFNSFVFGGSNLCSPCFKDGTSGVPVGDRDGLVQGMAGSEGPIAGAKPDGLIKQPVSADGSHLVFGSTSQFEPDGNDATGDVSIYERDLRPGGTTEVISKTPSGDNLPCLQGSGACHSPGNGDGIAELAISADGASVVVAQRVSTDSAGNSYWHPYLHIGTNTNTVDLAPGTTSGVLFDGMTADGSMVFFTTRDQLNGNDTDASTDVYVDRISSPGPVTPELVSVGAGGQGNSDSCHPVANWNTVSGGPNCDVVAFAGGAGLAADSGTFYFVSPELLDGASGEVDQANLYVVEPGRPPHFVAVLDSSAYKPPPQPPGYQLVNSSFITGLSSPGEIAVDQLTGDVYVTERGAGQVSRYTSAGLAKPFTSVQPYIEANKITGQNLGGGGEGQVSVDSANSSPFKGAIYITTNGGAVRVYANSGEKLGELTGFNEACGVSVDPANGDVYVGDYANNVWRFKPISAVAPVTNASYFPKEGINTLDGLCNIDAQSPSFIYSWNYSGGVMRQFPKSAFVAGTPISPSATPIGSGRHAQSDPQNGDFYVNEATQVTRYSSSGTVLEKFGSGLMNDSRGVAIDATSKHVYVTSGTGIQEYDSFTPPYHPIDNPAVVHGLMEHGVHRLGDFQVSPDGRFAAFNSSAPITNFDSFGHLEVYRYDTGDGSIVCASCAPTNSQATKDAVLPQHGNAMTSDGRVFFDSNEPLVLRDTNGNEDAYEWKDGKVYLISSGTSPFDSGMLSVSVTGKDAFFFTREKMAPEDLNGSVMRIYDAREDGGFFHIPEPPQCKASDECHGPGSQAPVPPGVGSRSGTEGNTTKHCKSGFVRKRGKCVRKKHGHAHHRGRKGRGGR